MNDFVRTLSLVPILLAFGCTKTPDVPSLPGNPPTSIEQVLVGSDFTPSDARNIFAALNKNGRLNSLKSWFTATDEELTVWSDFFNTYFYQEALQTNGILHLLEKRTDRGGFRSLHLNPSKETVSAIQAFLNYPLFPKLAKQSAAFLVPELYRALSRTDAEADLNYKEIGTWPIIEPLKAAQGAADVVAFFQDEVRKTALSRLGDALENSNFAENILETLSSQYSLYKSAAPFEGFVYGLGKRLQTKETESLFDTLRLLNQPSNGIFSHAHKTLERDPELGRIFGRLLDPRISKAAFHFIKRKIDSHPKEFWTGLVRKDPSLPPTQEFVRLFTDITDALTLLTSQSFNAPLLERTPIYLASLVITERIEDALKTKGAEGSIDLLSAQISKDLDALPGMKPFKEVLATLVAQESFGSRTYGFPEAKNASFDTLLESTIQTVQATHRFADAAGLIMPLLRRFTLSGAESITLKDFETPNMLDSLHRFLAGITLETWNRLDYLLFEDFQIGRMSDTEKQPYLQLWLSDEKLLDRVTTVWNSIEVLHTFNKPIQKNLPTVVSFLHGFLSDTRSKSDELRGATSLMKFVSESDLLKIPFVRSQLEAGQPFAKLLYQLSLLSKEERELLTSVLDQSLSRDLFKFGEEFSKSSPEALRTAVSLLLENGHSVLPTLETITPEERVFLIRFLQSIDFESIWKFLQKYSSTKNTRALLNDLRGLLRDGGLLDAARLLSRIQNPLLKKFANVIENMILTGEFEAVLNTLEKAVPQ